MKFLMDKLNKIVWFYSSQGYFNYLVTRGTTQTLNMDTQDIMILQHLMIKEAEKLGKKTDWIADPDSFRRNLKWGLSWANDKKNALIFKYKPSDETKNAQRKFDAAKEIYKMCASDNSYETMEKAFVSFFNLL